MLSSVKPYSLRTNSADSQVKDVTHVFCFVFWYPQGTLNGYELKAMRGVALWNTMDQSCERCSPHRLLVCNNAITLNYILPQTLLAWLDTCLGLSFTSVNSPCPPVFVVFSHRFCVVGLNSDAAFRSLYECVHKWRIQKLWPHACCISSNHTRESYYESYPRIIPRIIPMVLKPCFEACGILLWHWQVVMIFVLWL